MSTSHISRRAFGVLVGAAALLGVSPLALAQDFPIKGKSIRIVVPFTAGGGTDTDANHIANLTDPSKGLIADLGKPADKVPAFSWITPNNCSDAHDATCKGNNLSGVFDANGNPNYSLPLTTAPTNYTGGLYASDLWLRYYIPLIERSAAFKDGGLIDITFDEATRPSTRCRSTTPPTRPRSRTRRRRTRSTTTARRP